MMTKKLIYTTIVAILFAACSKEESMPLDVTSMGVVASDRVNVCTGQEFLLACPIATSELATGFVVQWGAEGTTLTEQDSYEQGVSYKKFSFEKAGTYQIKCVARYNYGSEGVKLKEQSTKILIKNAQFRGVLLGDDIETAKAKNPNMKRLPLFPTTQFYSDEVSPSLTYYFFFEQDKLYMCRTNETLPPSNDSPLTLFKAKCDKYRDVATAPSRYIEKDWDPTTGGLYEPTEQEKLIFEKFGKNEELSSSDEDAIIALMKKSLIRLKATMTFVDDEKVYIETELSSTANQYQALTFVKYIKNETDK